MIFGGFWIFTHSAGEGASTGVLRAERLLGSNGCEPRIQIDLGRASSAIVVSAGLNLSRTSWFIALKWTWRQPSSSERTWNKPKITIQKHTTTIKQTTHNNPRGECPTKTQTLQPKWAPLGSQTAVAPTTWSMALGDGNISGLLWFLDGSMDQYYMGIW